MLSSSKQGLLIDLNDLTQTSTISKVSSSFLLGKIRVHYDTGL
jgi:hypothetical protein